MNFHELLLDNLNPELETELTTKIYNLQMNREATMQIMVENQRLDRIARLYVF